MLPIFSCLDYFNSTVSAACQHTLFKFLAISDYKSQSQCKYIDRQMVETEKQIQKYAIRDAHVLCLQKNMTKFNQFIKYFQK